MYTKRKALAVLSAVFLVFGLGFGCMAESEESESSDDSVVVSPGNELLGRAELAFNPSNCSDSNDWQPDFDPEAYDPEPGPSEWELDGDPETTIGAGATNRQTPQLAKKAARDYYGKGRAFKLYHELEEGMPVNPDANYELQANPPFIFATYQAYIGDTNNDPNTGLGTAFSQIGTQIDSFSHFAYNPPGNSDVNNLVYYGNLTFPEVWTPGGSSHVGVEHLKPIATRAILLDVKRFVNNNEMLPPGYEITLCDIMTTMHAQGMGQNTVKPGDVILINSGWEVMWNQPREVYYQGGPFLNGATPGINLEVAVQLAEWEITAAGYDAWAGDRAVWPPVDMDLSFPVHHELLVKNGITQIESMHLGELAEAMWEKDDGDGKKEAWMAYFEVEAVPMVGASGSTVTPIARY